jgi:hypothetical protein
MSPSRQNPEPEPGCVDVTGFDAVSRSEQLLERVKVVAQRITERVRRAAGDTLPETPALSGTDPDSQPLAPDQSPPV